MECSNLHSAAFAHGETHFRPCERTEKTYALLATNRQGSQGELRIEFDYQTRRVRKALPDEEGGVAIRTQAKGGSVPARSAARRRET